MKILLEILLIAVISAIAGIIMGWGMDDQITRHTDHVLRVAKQH